MKITGRAPPPGGGPAPCPRNAPPSPHRVRSGRATPHVPGRAGGAAIASAWSSAVSATTTPCPTRSSIPSQPSEVDTTGRPTSSASMILSRVPPPARSGATTTRARARYGLTSSTVPVTSMLSSASSLTAGAGSLPTSKSRASGTRRRTRGQISRPSQSAASTLGAQPMVATNATVGSAALGSTAEGSRPLGQTSTERRSGLSRARLLLADDHHRIEGPDGPALHPPQRGRLGPVQEGRGPAAGPGVAVHQGRFDVVEVEDRLLGREVEHEGHHLLVFDLQEVDPFLVGSTPYGLDQRRAPEAARGHAAGRAGRRRAAWAGVTRQGTARTSIPRSRRPSRSAVPSS